MALTDIELYAICSITIMEEDDWHQETIPLEAMKLLKEFSNIFLKKLLAELLLKYILIIQLNWY